jgi:hypothetical protein
MKLKIIGLAACLVFACATLPASAGEIALEANAAHVKDITGGELGAGYRFSIGPVHIAPYVGAFLYQEDDSSYHEETFRNGNTVCRDTRNGQFADEEKCDDLNAKVYGKLEATINVLDFADVGGGVRFSEDQTTPYFALAINVVPHLSIRGNVGKDYWSGGLHIAF